MKELIMVGLLKLKNGDIPDTNHGICRNLVEVLNKNVDSTEVYKFLFYTFNTLYGKSVPAYPIEGIHELYSSNKKKWDVNTDFGKKRIELLEQIINLTQEDLNK